MSYEHVGQTDQSRLSIAAAGYMLWGTVNAYLSYMRGIKG
jgi:hypothetical protein